MSFPCTIANTRFSLSLDGYPPPATARAMVQSDAEHFRAWIQAHLDLIASERAAEVEETRLLFSKSSHHLLALNGLALLNLCPVNVSLGLGGKTLIELEPDAAFSKRDETGSASLGNHTFRPGDLAGLCLPEGSGNKKGRTKDEVEAYDISGVVSKVWEGKIVLAVSDNNKTKEELEVPQRCNMFVPSTESRDSA